MSKFDRISKTSHAGIGYTRITRGCWMFVDIHDPAHPRQVGLQYVTKEMLLADMPRYLAEWA